MKKNLLAKMVALTLAVVTALTPVTADAAEKKVVTRKDYDATAMSIADKYREVDDDDEFAGYYTEYYAYIKTLNGCYQKDGRKIYCVLNNATKTFTKTGKYSIVAGGVSAKKDQGRVVFKAPKSGTYKFTMSTKNNVVGSDIAVYCVSDYGCKWGPGKYKYHGKLVPISKTSSCGTALLDDPATDGVACKPNSGTIFDGNGGATSTMKKLYFTTTIKKGQTVRLEIRDSSASMDEPVECAYNFCGMDLDITKIK